MRLLQDFVSALYFSKLRVSSFIIAPPSTGKSFSLRSILQGAKGVEFVTKITEAGLRNLLETKSYIHTIVFSDATNSFSQRREYSVWNAMLEATEEGVSTIWLGNEDFQIHRRVAFFIAMTGDDFVNFCKKIDKYINIDALLSRFLIFRYTVSQNIRNKMFEGRLQVPMLQYPKQIVFHDETIRNHVMKIAKMSYEREVMSRIARNTYYVALAFYEITKDLNATLRLINVLFAMRNKYFDMEDVEKYVYEGFQEQLWKEELRRAISIKEV